eukprot:TRINITY_DN6249_c0_g1_i1.p1 TRINITY_DN6249_c0_g1~~TRINITY_DN6249_c0_g1_i1.p1  ORF type:complete len:374 (-),score=146.79 TRINITY_DN6249_c0_g1_i1:33-1070(-)
MADLITEISSLEQFESILEQNADKLVVVNFWARWCDICKHMNDLFGQLSKSWSPNVVFLQVEADDQEAITEKYEVDSVPTFYFYYKRNRVEVVLGAQAQTLAVKVETWVGKTVVVPEQPQALPENEHSDRIKKLTTCAPVMVFVRGKFPECEGCEASRDLIALLRSKSVPFSAFDVSLDAEIQEGLKTYSGWPSVPQIWTLGKLVGGLDTLREIDQKGEWDSTFSKAIEETKAQEEQQKQNLNARLSDLINKAPVMLFMKGTPDAPRCGFSSKIVGLLQDQGIRFESFNILSDSEVREGLKIFSKWPTFPQLYVEGKLLGGLDIVKEMIDEGELRPLVPAHCLDD